jgi:hypothetical protein
MAEPEEVYFLPHQVRSSCGRDPLVINLPGRQLPLFMNLVMANQAVNDPPNAPTDLFNYPPTSEVVEVIWSPPLIGGSTGYYVYYNTVDDFATAIQIDVENNLAYVVGSVSPLIANQEYFIYITAYNSVGESISSDFPPIYTLAGTPTDLTPLTVTDVSIETEWTLVTTGNGTNGYIPYSNIVNDFATADAFSTLSELSSTYTFGGLTPDTQYFFWVTSLNDDNIESPPSDAATAITLP